MLTLPLEPTDDRAAPVFKDAATCTAWLAQFQLTNLQQAHSYLLMQLHEFNRYPMQGLERFHSLETLRETIEHVQEDMAKKLMGKALPLGEHELMVFMSITQQWQALVTGYQRCLQAYLAGDKKLAELGALLCERCLHYSGSAIFEHLRAGYECNPKLWYQLHDLYAFAEEQGFQEREVDDSLNRYGVRNSCRSTYVKILLACYARPAELSRVQLKLLDRWLARWSKEVRVETRYSLSKGDAQPLAVDLSSTQGLQTVAQCQHTAQLRYLPMVPMSKLLRVKIILLQQGSSLEQVGLGELPSNTAAISLLNFLHLCWCEEDRERILARNTIGSTVQFCYTPEMIFAYLNGKVALPHNKPNDSANGAAPAAREEAWTLNDETVLGAKLSRHELASGRLNLHQLVAVRRDAQQPFKLGAVAWLRVSVQGILQLGVSYVPGLPEAIHVQIAGGATHVAFLLPEILALRSPSSLMVPRHVYKAGGILQIIDARGGTKNVKMGISVTCGFDYERISYTAI